MGMLQDNLNNKIITNTIDENNIFDVHGKSNEIIVNTEEQSGHIKCVIRGDNNKISIDEKVIITGMLDIYIGGSDISISIGANTSIGKAIIRYAENGTKLSIGKDCMISDGVEIWGTDMHAIIDNKSREVVNCAKEIIIEDHCWIGTRSIILKNVQLNKGCVIAAGSIVTSNVPCNSIVGGTPARVIKKDISWFRELPQKLNTERSENFSEECVDNRESIATIENFYDSNHIIKGWIFLVDVDSSQTEIYLEFEMRDGKIFTFCANKERRNDVAEAFDDDRYMQTGFWLKVPEYIFRDDIKKCRVICKNNNIFGSKQIEIQQKSDV